MTLHNRHRQRIDRLLQGACPSAAGMDIDLKHAAAWDAPILTRPIEPRPGAAFDPLVEEISFAGFELAGADPTTVASHGHLVSIAASFSQILEQSWQPGRTTALLELASVAAGDRPRLRCSLIVGIAGPIGTTRADVADLVQGARRRLRRWPCPYREVAMDPSEVLDVEEGHTAVITQRSASVAWGATEAHAVSRWDRDAASWLELADALLERPGTRLRTTLLSTELDLADYLWLQDQLAAATAIVRDTAEVDPATHNRARRAELTLVDELESYRTPVFCGEVAVLSPEPVSEVYLRGLGADLTYAFDILRRGETTTVAARARWVGGYAIERDPAGHREALAAGLPLRGGLAPRRLEDLFSLTEAACAFQWPIPVGRPIPTIPHEVGLSLPAPAGLSATGAVVGTSTDGGELYLSAEDRARHLHILGVTGTGKSTLIDHLVADDVTSGRAFVLIDPHGVQAARVVRRAEQEGHPVVRIDPDDPATARIALFPADRRQPADDEAVGRAVSRVIEAVTSHLPSDYSGPRFRELARMALTVVAHAEVDLGQVVLLLHDRDRATELVRRARGLGRPVPATVEAQLNAFHHPTNNDRASVGSWVASKFDELACASALAKVVAPAGSGEDLGERLRQGASVVVNLAGAEDLEARLLGHLVLGSVVDAVLDRAADGGPLLPVYVDEAHRFYPTNMSRALAEGRKYGLSLALAHQHLSQLELRARDAVLGGCGLRATFRVTDEDAHRLAGRLGVTPRELMGLANLEAVVHRTDLGAQPPYTCRLHPYEALETGG